MLQVEELPERMIIGMKRKFMSAAVPNSNAPQVIAPLWAEMSKKYFSMNLSRDDYPVGVGAMWRDDDLDDDASMVYFAGYEVHAIPENLQGLEALILESSKNAVFAFEGPLSDLPAVIVNFYSKLLPESGLARRAGIDLEIYYENQDPSHPPRVVLAVPVN